MPTAEDVFIGHVAVFEEDLLDESGLCEEWEKTTRGGL